MIPLPVVAHHEAGHAVAAWRMGADIEDVSAYPDRGVVVTRGPRGLPWRVFLDRRLLMIFAGPEAQRLFDPTSHIDYCAIKDNFDADNLLAIGFAPDVALIAVPWEQARAEAAAFVRREWPIISALAAELILRNHFSGDEAFRVMRETAAVNGLAIGT